MAMLSESRAGRLERVLRRLCRCDGMKDLAVAMALVAIFGSFAIRLASASAPVAPAIRSAVNVFS